MSSSTRVLAIAQPKRTEQCFLEVVAQVDQDRLVKVTDALKQFPKSGTVVIMPGRIAAPEAGQAVMCVVTTKSNVAAYPVSALLPMSACEIVDVPWDSTATVQASEHLLRGASISHPLRGPILLHFLDGVLAGPVQVEGKLGIVQLSREALAKPFSAWIEHEIEEITHQERRFAASLKLPDRHHFVDLAPVEVKIAWALKRIQERRSGLGISALTREGLREVADRLVDSHEMAWAKSRVEALGRALEHEKVAADAIDTLTEHLVTSAAFKRQLDARRESVDREVRAAAEAALAETRAQIDESRSRADTAEREAQQRRQEADEEAVKLAELRREVSTQRAKLEELSTSIVERVRARIETARLDPSSVLSEVLLLRPFLVGRNEPSSTEPLQERGWGAELDENTSYADRDSARAAVAESDLFAGLSSAATGVGLNKSSADTLARIVASATITGQLVSLRGAAASLVAERLARAVGAECLRLSLPAGMVHGAQLHRVLRSAGDRAIEHQALTSVVLAGLNRSPIEVYGDSLFELVAERMLEGAATAPLLLGTVADGTTALPADELTRLGPVVDLDDAEFRWGAAVAPSATLVQLDTLRKWRADLSIPDADEVNDLVGWSKQCPLARRAQELALQALRRLEGAEDIDKTISALAVGWLGPRSHVVGASKPALDALSGYQLTEWAKRAMGGDGE